MSSKYYNRFNLPSQIKEMSEAGEFVIGNPDISELILVATVICAKGRYPVLCSFVHCPASTLIDTLMLKYRIDPADKLNCFDFKSWVSERLEEKVAVVVDVLIHFNSKVEVFTSFLTGSSLQLFEGLVKGKDLSSMIKKVDTPMKSRYVNCAYCLAQKGHLDCKCEAWNRPIQICGGCESTFYCSKACQKADFTRGHSIACDLFTWLSPNIEKDGTEDDWIHGVAKKFAASVHNAVKLRGGDSKAVTPEHKRIEFDPITGEPLFE